MQNSDKISVNLSGFDYSLIQMALRDLYHKRLSSTPWVRKPDSNMYWYEGSKESRQVESLINHLDKQANQIDAELTTDILLTAGFIRHPDLTEVFMVPESKNFAVTYEPEVGWYFVLVIYQQIGGAGYITLAECDTVYKLNKILDAFGSKLVIKC